MSIWLSISNVLGSIADGLLSFVGWVFAHIPEVFVGAVILGLLLAIKDQREEDRLLYKKTDYILLILMIANGFIVFRNSAPSDSFFAVIAHTLIPAIFALIIGGVAHSGFECGELTEILLVVGSFIGFTILTIIFQETLFYFITLCLGIAILVGIVVFFRKHPLLWLLFLLRK